ncbi:MAG: pentapeptide repeat-containing protein [Cyanobacteria bacterium P01_D01_bin.56]
MLKWVYGADIFNILERLSPTLEAIGVLMLPVVLFFAAQQYQESVRKRDLQHQENLQARELEKIRQETVANYLNQLSTILLEIEGNLGDSQHEKLRTLTTATTITLLNDPNLDAIRKGQVIQFLTQMELVNVAIADGSEEVEPNFPILSLNGVNLSGANLAGASLSNASLRGADLSRADLSGADLIGADLGQIESFVKGSGSTILVHQEPANLRLSWMPHALLANASLIGADLTGATLYSALLTGTDLSNANLTSTAFQEADLSNVDFFGSDLRNSNLLRANLSNAKNLTPSQLDTALLCQTQLPEYIEMDSNRDCAILRLRMRQGEF